MPANLREFFSKTDNIISVLTILIATLLLFFDIFNDGLTANGMFEVILIVLVLLTITNMIERETRFKQTDRKVDEIKNYLQQEKHTFFLKSSELPDIRELAKDASEIFLSGGSLHIVDEYLNFWEEWLKEGKSLKMILLNPDNPGLKDLHPPNFNYSYEVYKMNIELSLERIQSLKSIPNANFEVRLSDICPTQGVTILDGHNSGTVMYIGIYLPNEDSNTRPHFSFTRKHDEEWFELFYDRYYKFLWGQAKELQAGPD